MSGFKTLMLLGLLVSSIALSYGLSDPCMSVYNQGGVPAVSQVPECSHRILSTQNQTMNCQFDMIQNDQEDRISCNLDMQISLPGRHGPNNVKVGVVAVFDGHFGKGASDMASKLLLDYFLSHTAYISSKVPSPFKQEQVMVYEKLDGDGKLQQNNSNITRDITPIHEESTSIHKRILKEALLRTIHDIDLTFSKSQEALGDDLFTGTTATVAVLVDGQILVANVGDSKAILCSKDYKDTEGAGKLIWHVSVKELTRDHHPTREDERARLKAAGGVIYWIENKPVVSGPFWLTRAIGTMAFKRYGVIAEAEVTDWQPLTAGDRYLVLGTRGIFRELTPHIVCDLLTSPNSGKARKLVPPCFHWESSASCIVSAAYAAGSMDDLSAIVLRLM